MNLVILWLTFFSQVSISVSQNDTQCIENPTGEVSLNVAVRGVPGPEGPQGHKGDIGHRGEMGLRGDRGVQGKKGERGDIGPVGPKGVKGKIGMTGQKGVQGIQGIPGPAGSPGLPGSRGKIGLSGPEGTEGPPGQPGHPGPRGVQGRPGDTMLTAKEFNLVTNSVHNSVLASVNTTIAGQFDALGKTVEKLNRTVLQEVKLREDDAQNTVMAQLRAMNETLNMLKLYSPGYKCGLFGNWSRIAYFDTTQGDSCPTGLRTVVNTTTNQKACGRTNTRGGCASVPISVQFSYSQVCGIVKGYQYHSPDAFEPINGGHNTIDTYYVDGVSITHGSPRRHLWTYANGLSELDGTQQLRCPCARSNPNDWSVVPTFVGEHFYCESGFSGTTYHDRVVWEDPLWDGQNCVAPGNKCCERYGWFHRNVPSSTDDIELRICADQTISNEDTLVNHYEFWVM